MPKASNYQPIDPLLNARDAALETGRALSTFWRDVRRKTLPEPVYINDRMPRWRRSELVDAIGRCPRGKNQSRTNDYE